MKISVIIIIINKLENLFFRFLKNVKSFTLVKIVLIINYFVIKWKLYIRKFDIFYKFLFLEKLYFLNNKNIENFLLFLIFLIIKNEFNTEILKHFISIKLYARILLRIFKFCALNFFFYLQNNFDKILKITFYLSNFYYIFKLN